jgi:hypothetical protein
MSGREAGGARYEEDRGNRKTKTIILKKIKKKY